MKVEIWSDYLCPFCYIGKRRFEQALNQFSHKEMVEVVFRSFELNPNAERDIQGDIHSVLASKYGMSWEKAKAMNDDLGKQAKLVGLDYQFDTMIPTNSFDAHRLTHFAADKGKSSEMIERLFKAYFTDSKHIGDRKVLAELAEEIGLEKSEAMSMLSSEDYSNQVQANEQEGQQLGIQGVPFFVINRKYGISGAQPSEVFLETLQKVWDEENSFTMINEQTNAAGDSVCEDGSCSVPKQNS